MTIGKLYYLATILGRLRDTVGVLSVISFVTIVGTLIVLTLSLIHI